MRLVFGIVGRTALCDFSIGITWYDIEITETKIFIT